MLPILKLVSDGKEHKYRDLIESLAIEFQITDVERKEMLASGNQAIFDNRVGWAKTYLKKAGLLDSPKRATFTITELGKETLLKNPSNIDSKFLRQFPAFLEFQNVSKTNSEVEEYQNSVEDNLEQTPEESLDKAYQRIRKSLASELLNKVIELSPAFFERLVVELLVKMGYGGSIKDAGKAIGKSGDEGIDGTIKEDKLGLDIIYIQAKRWKPGNIVGRPEIQIEWMNNMREMEYNIIQDNNLLFNVNKNIDDYEHSMLRNIYSFYRNHSFENAVFMCGSAHRKTITEKIHDYSKREKIKLDWEFYQCEMSY